MGLYFLPVRMEMVRLKRQLPSKNEIPALRLWWIRQLFVIVVDFNLYAALPCRTSIRPIERC